MKIYNQLLQEIKNDLSKENIESNEYQISLYDLYSLVNDEYKELRSITQNKKAFTNKELFRRPSYDSVQFGYDEEKSWIMLWFRTTLSLKSIWIQKEHGSKEFFITKFDHFSEINSNKFIRKYYNEIMQTLFTLEKYGTELSSFNSSINKFNIENSNYKFSISIGSKGNVDLNIELKDEVENKEMYKREYYGKDSLMKILNDSKYELAKKIKIDVNTLDNSIVEQINKSKKNNNKKIVK